MDFDINYRSPRSSRRSYDNYSLSYMLTRQINSFESKEYPGTYLDYTSVNLLENDLAFLREYATGLYNGKLDAKLIAICGKYSTTVGTLIEHSNVDDLPLNIIYINTNNPELVEELLFNIYGLTPEKVDRYIYIQPEPETIMFPLNEGNQTTRVNMTNFDSTPVPITRNTVGINWLSLEKPNT